MQPEVHAALTFLLDGHSLDENAIRSAIGAIMDGRCGEVEIASLLTALAMKKENAIELAGAALAMRDRSARIRSSRSGLMDTCGTGGDQLHTFNISTATALVLAAAGVPVAKHGNRSVSSTSGSAEVLEALGVNISLTAEQAGRCLDDVGICFCYARLVHAAMKHVAPVRQQLGFRTIFNLLGPLTNPASAEFQLLGAHRYENAEKLALAARRLGLRRGFVVCGNDELDEVSLWGSTRVWEVRGESIREFSWTAADFGLPECRVDQLRVSSSAESAEVIRGILEGRPGAARDMVLANAAAALLCHGDAQTLPEAVAMIQEAIDSGRGLEILQKLVDWTRNSASSG